MVLDEERIPLIIPSTVINSSPINKYTLSWLHLSAETPKHSSCCRFPSSTHTVFNQHTEQKQSRLLCDLSGVAQPGQILAIMGTSGVGKFYTYISRNRHHCIQAKRH
jgi:hypothetical protein